MKLKRSSPICNNLLNPDIWPKRKRKREGGWGDEEEHCSARSTLEAFLDVNSVSIAKLVMRPLPKTRFKILLGAIVLKYIDNLLDFYNRYMLYLY